MKESEKLVGKIRYHKVLGKVSVDSIYENSRVLVNVTIMDRGEGYDKVHNNYKGVKVKSKEGFNGWSRSENREFGNKDVVHIKDLTK